MYQRPSKNRSSHGFIRSGTCSVSLGHRCFLKQLTRMAASSTDKTMAVAKSGGSGNAGGASSQAKPPPGPPVGKGRNVSGNMKPSKSAVGPARPAFAPPPGKGRGSK